MVAMMLTFSKTARDPKRCSYVERHALDSWDS